MLVQFTYTKINLRLGVKETDTGLAAPNLWDLMADRQLMGEMSTLQVARCTKIIPMDEEAAAAARAVNPAGAVQGQKGADEQDKYVVNITQIAKFVVGLGERVAATDIEEGMRVGYVYIDFLRKLSVQSFTEWIVINIKFKYLYHQKSMRQ